VWDSPRRVPVIAKYFLPGEKERVDELFREFLAAGEVVTPEVDAKFDQLASERIAAHPFRTVILPPLSRIPRLWITPRLSSFGLESARLAGVRGKLLFVSATAFNAIFAILAFTTGLIFIRRPAVKVVLAVPVYLTLIHCFLMGGAQARYVVPAFPQEAVLAAWGTVLLLARLRQQRPVEP
jgi:hypothetical protein